MNNLEISPTEFDQLPNKEDFFILDVRSPEEKSEGFIDGATQINIQNASFYDEIQELDRNQNYLVYCRSGQRSMRASLIMKDLNFTGTIYSLKGGIKAWNQSKK